MKVETETWQVMTQGEIYQADLPTLKQWIGEGLVQPTDRVRKGELKWIEAQRAPVLRRVFNGEEVPPPSEPRPESDAAEQHTQTNAAETSPPAGAEWSPSQDLGLPRESGAAEPFHNAASQHAWGAPPTLGTACHLHPEQAAKLVCRSCQQTFCRPCAKQVTTSSILLCPLCGNFCDPLERIAERQKLYEFQGSGFGFADFAQALAYPFKHLASLLGGALLYAFLLLAGMRAQFLAAALLFGCISLIIHRVAYGRLDRDFLPDFSEFSFWDDVIVPCFLGLGVMIVTVGPVCLMLLALLLGWFGGPKQPTASALVPPTLAQTQPPGVTKGDMGALIDGGTAEQETELEKKVRRMSPAGQLSQQVEASKQDDALLTVVRQLTARPGLILLLALGALGWAVFYHPMALLVAGWTESFKATINPLVGLDTIRHMGLTYVKAFLMYLAVQVVGFVAGLVVAFVTSPFDMPFVGNMPGRFIGGVVTFYTSLVIACVLGLALFKSADRLGIEIE